jgi:hypothetical protein
MRVRKSATAVEKGAVNVDREQTDHLIGIDVYATTAIFQAPFSRVSVN